MSETNNQKIQHTTKHVSRACLECRSRHLKCGGQEPVCERCKKHKRMCTYVKSHRGGSRKKGCSLKKKMKTINENCTNIINSKNSDINDDNIDNCSDENNERIKINKPNSIDLSRKELSFENSSTDATLTMSNSNTVNTTPIDENNFNPKNLSKSNLIRHNHKSEILPCVKNGLGHLADNPNCSENCLHIENYNNIPPCMKVNGNSNITPNPNENKNSKNINFHPIFNGSKDKDPVNIIFDEKDLAKSLDKCYLSPNLINNLNMDSIISSFYNFFYSSHPFLPDKKNIIRYLDSIPYKYDLLLAMKIMGEGQTTSKYARDIETVNYLILSLLKCVRQIGKDFISLQTLLLLAMISHISSLHDLSTIIREATISLALEMKLNYIDEANISSVFLDVNGFLTERDEKNVNVHLLNTPSDVDSKSVLDSLFNSRRTIDIPHDILIDTMRKTFWELYYFDSISGTASGHTKSRLAIQHCLVLYPTSIPLTTFDYKSRAEACKLVNDAISLNIAIQSNADSLPHLNHMRAALGNWEMKLSNPETYGMPYLINKYGVVNDGVFEAIMLLNYARIFTHRPFSYLWRADVSKHPRCTDENGIDDPCPPLDNKETQNSTDSRKIIETRKTIDSANFLMKTLLDSDPAQTCKRTPFLACALAFSCLVHLSAYAWVESNLSLLDSLDENNRQISASELDTYTEYIKLEIGSTLQISRHWSLSAKLITHILETLSRVSPKLYKKVQTDILGLGFNIQNPTSNTDHSNSSSKSSPQALGKEKLDSSSFNDKLKVGMNMQKKPDTLIKNGGQPLSNAVPSYMLMDQDISPSTTTTSSASSASELLRYPNQQILTSQQPVQQFAQPNTQIDSNAQYNNINNTSNSNEITNPGINNFMLEFNDLVSSMNTINQNNPADYNGSSDFASEFQDYGFLDPLSPSSDTGCDWVDKHVFQFDTFSAANGV